MEPEHTTKGHQLMLRNSFLRHQRAAEAAGYPSLLIVTAVALAIIVSAFTVLVLMKSVWALVWAAMCMFASAALVVAAIYAAASDEDGPAAQRDAAGPRSSEGETVVPLSRPGLADAQRGPDRRAA